MTTYLITIARRMKAAKSYVAAARRYGEFLDRAATVADLTLDNWQRFEVWVEALPNTQRQRDDFRHRLRILWAHAIADGHDQPLPPKRCKGTVRTPDQWEGEPLPDRSLAGFFEGYYLPLRLRSRSKNTRRLYAYTVRNFGRYLGRHATLDDLTDETVAGLLLWMADNGKAPHSRQKEAWQLAAIWRAACRKGLLTVWPDIQPEKLPARTPNAWTLADLEKLFEAIRATTGTIAGIPAAHWWEALHRVLLCSAERISAALGLLWSDFDAETGWLNFRAECRKGGRQDNACRLSASAVASLERIREPSRDLIFPWDLAPSYLWRKYAEILQAAGLSADSRSKFHRLRRTTASHFEAAGGNATALLTHSNRKVTLAYLDPRICKPQQAIDLLGDLLEGGDEQ